MRDWEGVGRPVKRVIYVVEDDEAVRDSFRALLESYGMGVEDFASAEDFLRRSTERSTAVVQGCLLLDIHMPGMSGLELLETLHAANSVLPVIVITGRSNRRLRERLIRAGVCAVLDKPIDGNVLLSAIESAVGSSSEAPQL